MFRIACYTALEDALPLWQNSQAMHAQAVYGQAVYGIAQSALWVQHWQRNVNPDCLVLALFIDEQPALLLPLEVVRHKRMKIARFTGGSHANCNFPVLFTAHAGAISTEHIQALIACLKQQRPDIALLSLTRQSESWLGYANPLLVLQHRRNPNPALMASLPDDFDTVLARSNAARKRKKHRHHARRYDETGAWRIYTAQGEAENSAAFEAFYAMKSERFAMQGIANSFAEDAVQRFFRALFADARNEEHRQYRLHVLEVAGKARAVIGCSYWQGVPDAPSHMQPHVQPHMQYGLTVEFGAFANDDLVTASPGDFLFYESIARAIAEKLDYFSFGIGEEKYKRDWCDIEQALYDSHIALRFSGQISAVSSRIRSELVYRIKNNPRLWELAKKLRQKLRRKS